MGNIIGWTLICFGSFLMILNLIGEFSVLDGIYSFAVQIIGFCWVIEYKVSKILEELKK